MSACEKAVRTEQKWQKRCPPDRGLCPVLSGDPPLSTTFIRNPDKSGHGAGLSPARRIDEHKSVRTHS